MSLPPAEPHRQELQAWIDPRLTVRPSPIHGSGMFASEAIAAGETLVVWGGVVFTEEDLRQGRAAPSSVAALGDGLYLGDPAGEEHGQDYYLNHSCDPNAWMSDARTLVARCDIQPGEEVLADYALWECDPTWSIRPCRCGVPGCRGQVTGGDWQLPELQARYGDHFSPHITSLQGYAKQ